MSASANKPVIGGVCYTLAKKMNMEAWIMRVIFVCSMRRASLRGLSVRRRFRTGFQCVSTATGSRRSRGLAGLVFQLRHAPGLVQPVGKEAGQVQCEAGDQHHLPGEGDARFVFGKASGDDPGSLVGAD